MDAEEFQRKEYALGHAIQSAVAYGISRGDPETQPKHLRVGVDMAMSQHAGLVKLLVDKGIITSEEYFDLQIELLTNEVAMYERRYAPMKFA